MGDRWHLWSGLWQDDRLSPAIKIEDIILVAEGLRPSSLLILPVNLPDGGKVGELIDQVFNHTWRRGYLPGAPIWRRPFESVWRRASRMLAGSSRYRASLAREAYRLCLSDSASYQALRLWADRLGLESLEATVRPTIDEMYLATGEAVLEGLNRVLQLRREARHRALEEKSQGGALVFRAFPEERDRAFLVSLGRLLGYPECCVERYAEERVAGVNVEERASRQLIGLGSQVEDHAYYSRDFFPCQPDCPRAGGKGKAGLRILSRLEEECGARGMVKAYKEIMAGNRKLVKEYPDLIRRHEKAMQKKGMSGRISGDEHE